MLVKKQSHTVYSNTISRTGFCEEKEIHALIDPLCSIRMPFLVVVIFHRGKSCAPPALPGLPAQLVLVLVTSTVWVPLIAGMEGWNQVVKNLSNNWCIQGLSHLTCWSFYHIHSSNKCLISVSLTSLFPVWSFSLWGRPAQGRFTCALFLSKLNDCFQLNSVRCSVTWNFFIYPSSDLHFLIMFFSELPRVTSCYNCRRNVDLHVSDWILKTQGS